MNPYFTVNDSEHFTFYRIPKLLFTDEIYQTVSTACCWIGCPYPRRTTGKTSTVGSTNISPSIRRRNCCISDTKRSAACLQSWM